MTSKQVIIELERKFWETMLSKDAETASSLVATNLLMTGAQGVAVIERSMFASMMDGASWDLEKYEMDDVSVLFPSPDVALIGYTVTEQVVVDGKRMEMKAADASVWMHRDGAWQAVLHTESILGDSFGRDRAPAATPD